MTTPLSSLIEWAPAFALVLARIAPAMMLLPGLGEAAALSVVRVGLALAVTVLLLPSLRPAMPPLPDTGSRLALMIAADVATGTWFGWIARQTALVLPVTGQLLAYLTGLTSVLQPDPELGPQSTAIAKLFESLAPLMFLATGLYRMPLLALAGLFQLIPPGSVLPGADGVQSVIAVAGRTFALAVQLASPFIALALVWQLAMGLIGRLVGRMQIYFVSVPGHLLLGFLALMTAAGTMLAAWREGAEALLQQLPGG